MEARFQTLIVGYLKSMCGRYGRRGDKQHIAEHYNVRQVEYDLPDEHPYMATAAQPFAFSPNYNITPDSFQPVVRLSHETGELEFAVMKWGLVPYWSKTPKATFSSINARSENLGSGAWAEPFKRRRCLIPADFFYEWEPITKKTKQPWAVALKSGRLFSFGGIWDSWKDKATGERLESFSIITTEPNEVLELFHNRCPLIIDPTDYSRWLTPFQKENPASIPDELVRTYPSEVMEAWRVNKIGKDANGPELLVRAKAVESSLLFDM